MKSLSRWKIALSYFIDIRLRKLTSEKNGLMELFLSRGQYKLTTNHAVYSFGAHYRSFGHAFEQLGVYDDANLERVLVLGWGTGSIAVLLDGHQALQSIKGVEYDEELIALYHELHQNDMSFGIELVCCDAIDLTRFPNPASVGSYNLVCSDIFIDHLTPDAVLTPGYLNGLTAFCRPGGRVLLSKLNSNVRDRDQNNKLEKLLAELQIEYQVVNTIGNRMYTWLNRAPHTRHQLEIVRRSIDFSITWNDFSVVNLRS